MIDNAVLLERVKQGDKEAEEIIINQNMGLVWSIAKRFYGRGCEMDDLSQIGALGLIKAVKKFDTTFNVKFSTYAVPMIMGEIKRFLRDDGVIKVSRSLKELAIRGYNAQQRLTKLYGREPTILEIAKECEVEPENMVEALEAVVPPDSFDKTIYDNGDNKISMIDKLPADDTEDDTLNKIMIDDALALLKPRERQVIILRYFKCMTQTQVSQIIGVSQVQVSRIEKNVLGKLKEYIE